MMMYKSLVVATTLLGISASQSIPSIEADGRNINILTGRNGEVNFAANNGSMVSLQSMADQIEALSSTTQSQMDAMSSTIADLQGQIDAVPSMIDAHLDHNKAAYTWNSNLSPDQAIAQNEPNDKVIFVGMFPATAIVDVTVSDGGWCATIAQEFTFNSRWGLHLIDEGGVPTHSPDCYSLGTAQGAFDHFQFYFRNASTDSYWLYLYIPPYAVCGSDGSTPRSHTTVVETTVTGASHRVDFDETSSGAPTFTRPTSIPSNGYFPIEVKTYGTVDDQTDSIFRALSRNTTTWTYQSNLDAQNAVGRQNDIAVCIGQFDTNNILHIELDDVGCNSGISQNYVVHSKWGVHYAGDYDQPQIQSFGTAAETRRDQFEFSYRSVNPSTYLLFVYVKPWPVCGGNGSNAATHKLTVATQINRPAGAQTYTPTNVPPFNGHNGNTVGVQPLMIQAIGAESTMDRTYNWQSNLRMPTTENNTLTVLLGRFAADSVVDLDVGDSGWCAGYSVAFRFSSRWGVHRHTQNNSGGALPPLKPRCFTFGSSYQNTIRNNFHFYYAPAETPNGSFSTTRFLLYLFIDAYTVCGSDGVTPRPHVTVTSTRVHGSSDFYALDWFPTTPSNPFNYDLKQANDTSQRSYVEIPIEFATMQV